MTLKDKVIAVIQENSEDVAEIASDADLVNDVGIDSFGMIMIVNGIEDTFSITVKEEDIARIRTVDDITGLLQNDYGVKE